MDRIYYIDPFKRILISVYCNEFHLILDRIDKVSLINNIEKEIIILNDCSSDDSEAVIEKFMADNPTQNIQYHKHEVNKGKGAALHTGIANVKIINIRKGVQKDFLLCKLK